MTRLHLRPFSFSEADYDTVAAIETQVWPGEPFSKEALQYEDQEWDRTYFHERVIAEYDGQPIAYFQVSETPWAYEPHKYFLKLN